MNYIKTNIDNTQKNGKCWVCRGIEETVNRISECIKLALKESYSRHDWVEKVTHYELCKRLEFNHADKCYVQKPESVQEKETENSLGLLDTNRSLNSS